MRERRRQVKNHSVFAPVLLVALGLGMASGVAAQTTGGVTAQTTGTSATGTMNSPTAPDNTMKATAPNSSFSGWMTDYSKAHDGRVSRQAYMDEAGKRWDAADRNNQGLTSDQINGMYGYGPGAGNNSMNRDNKGK
jgi:hypothetical protein